MSEIRLFDRDEIERVIRLDTEMVQVAEDAFTALSTRNVQMPPIMRVDVPEQNGEVDIKSAYIEGDDSFAVKLSSGFFNNPAKGIPSANGMMILLSAITGSPKAIFADNGLLTDLRTAAAGAVAADHISRTDSRIAGIIGTGSQARLQLQALTLVRPIEKVLVYGRSKQKAEVYKQEMEHSLGLQMVVCSSAEEVVSGSDLVVTTTPATEPIIKGEWLHPGLHITAMGSDSEHKQELDPSVFDKADLVICDVLYQSLRLGELRSCSDQKIIDQVRELGHLTSGQLKGRTNDRQITICDLTGTGVQDTAIARHVYQLFVPEEEDDYERSQI